MDEDEHPGTWDDTSTHFGHCNAPGGHVMGHATARAVDGGIHMLDSPLTARQRRDYISLVASSPHTQSATPTLYGNGVPGKPGHQHRVKGHPGHGHRSRVTTGQPSQSHIPKGTWRRQFCLSDLKSSRGRQGGGGYENNTCLGGRHGEFTATVLQMNLWRLSRHRSEAVPQALGRLPPDTLRSLARNPCLRADVELPACQAGQYQRQQQTAGLSRSNWRWRMEHHEETTNQQLPERPAALLPSLDGVIRAYHQLSRPWRRWGYQRNRIAMSLRAGALSKILDGDISP
ncbi:hypothetical protein MAPG_09387 [Magnaporthiopsis poae ATCC 64411]|uniref:Uncharacterized protein n=1 Tax=Magnaporthiopsis poae (strain ATCC 64411 / 73-15) TaxID=644358 RepID=A0A0C4E9T8_MAGP6|nr:hypothetical protein MAPG_09387 [Magnaporthiopsis poae ATCC 64411]